jgi:hypothetical protein
MEHRKPIKPRKSWTSHQLHQRSHYATAASQGSRGCRKPCPMSEPPLTSHTKWRGIHPTILHHNKGIETCLSRRKNLTTAKKGIEICFSRHENLTAARNGYKHVLVHAKTLRRQETHINMF